MEARAWRRPAAVAILLSCAASAAGAAAWTVTRDISLTETYNHNPSLASADARRGDFITQISPGLRISGAGPRFRASFDYRPTLLFYARHSGTDELQNSLSAFGSLEAIERFFFIEATGNVTQTFLSPLGARPTDPTTITSNRIESRTFGLSPYLRGQLLRDYSYELRNRNTWTTTSEDQLGDVRRTQWTGRVASPIRLLGWALDYDDSTTHYDSAGNRSDLETRLFRASLYVQPEPAWRLSASVGRDENNYTGEDRSSTTRGAGILWNPGPRTTAELQYERRFFGPSRLARFQHRTRLTAWSVLYSRNISEYPQEVLRLPPGNTIALLDAIFAARIPDPVERLNALARFMRSSGTPLFLTGPLAFFTQQVFVEERAEASAGILGVRNSITFTVFASESSAVSQNFDFALPDAFLLGNQVRQHGFAVRADHRLTPFTFIGANVGRTFARQEEPTSNESRNDTAGLTLSHTVSRKTTSFAGVSVTRVESVGVATQNARSAFVGVNHQF